MLGKLTKNKSKQKFKNFKKLTRGDGEMWEKLFSQNDRMIHQKILPGNSIILSSLEINFDENNTCFSGFLWSFYSHIKCWIFCKNHRKFLIYPFIFNSKNLLCLIIMGLLSNSNITKAWVPYWEKKRDKTMTFCDSHSVNVKISNIPVNTFNETKSEVIGKCDFCFMV